MRKTTFWLILVLLATTAWARPRELSLVPRPVEVKRHRGWFVFEPGRVGVVLGKQATEDDRFAAQLLQEEVQKDLGVELPLGEARRVVVLALPARDTDLAQICRKAKAVPDEQLGDEGYLLVVSPKRIVVSANTSTGLFYGVQTLRQLVRGNAVGRKIPCVRIRDYPALPYRGQQDDLSRGPVRTKEFLKKEIRRLAELKLNMTTYYTEHIFRTKSHPDFAPAGGSLTAEDVRELSDYARKYHVTLVGNFQSFGHFRNILKYPKFEPLGENDWVLSPALKESYKLLSDILGEIAPAYPAKFFNVNCDETWGLGTGASKEMVEKHGIAWVYAKHLNWLHDELAKYGKRMMMWGDIALKHPEIIPQIHHDTIMLSWGYSAKDSFVSAIRPFREAGFDVMVCPGVSCWSRIFPNFAVARVNIHNYVRDGVAEGAMGMLNTAWFDDGESLFSTSWYGIAYGAEQAWNPGELDDTTFARRFAAAVYGDRSNGIGQAIEVFAEIPQYSVVNGLNNRVFWKPLLPKKGQRLAVGLAGWEPVVEHTRLIQSALERAKPTHYALDVDYIRFAAERVAFIPKMRGAVLIAAQEYRKACLAPLSSPEVGEHLRAAHRAIGEVLTGLTRLKQEYERLWLAENRMWWLENNLAKYDERLAELQQVQNWLSRAIADWEKGQTIPAPRDIRLDIRPLTGDFLTGWLVVGPFTTRDEQLPAGKASRLDVDYLESVGGEANVQPATGDRVKTPDGRTLTWRYVEAQNDVVDLAKLLGENPSSVAYAYCEIESPEARSTALLVGSNDGVKIYLNGRRVHLHRQGRGLTIDEDHVPVQLQAGVNRLLLKVDQLGGSWGFAVRLLGARLQRDGYRHKVVKFE